MVALKQNADGSLVVELLQQHHGEGIGWFNQRSFVMDSRQLRQLRELLGRSDVAESLEACAEEPRAIVPFPGPREAGRHRRAAGGR